MSKGVLKIHYFSSIEALIPNYSITLNQRT